MRGVVFLGERQLAVLDHPDPSPGPDEVVLGIKASGMCGTDLHYFRGPTRTKSQLRIAGHEPCGVVVAVGSSVNPAEAKVGERVINHHYDGCRVCHSCRSGWTQMCSGGKKRTFGGAEADGAHAPFMKVPAHTLIKMPDALTFKAGAAIACGTGTAYGALKRLALMGDETIAIFGQGPVGLSGTLFAKAMGARVIAIDVVEDRLRTARNLGADHIIDAAREDVVEAVRALTRRGEGVDKTMECSSSPGARRQSIEVLKLWGTACMVGVNGTVTFDVNDAIQGMRTIIGSWTFSKNILDDCAHYVVERGLDIGALFTNEFDIEQAKQAYDLFDTSQIGKGVFLFD